MVHTSMFNCSIGMNWLHKQHWRSLSYVPDHAPASYVGARLDRSTAALALLLYPRATCGIRWYTRARYPRPPGPYVRRRIHPTKALVSRVLFTNPASMGENAGDDNVFMSSSAAAGHGAHVSGSTYADHPSLSPSTGFSGQSIEADSGRRSQHFRKLISDIAEHLDKNDVDKIIWQKELPQKMKDKPALSVLEYLYKKGDFAIGDLRPLTHLLKEIHREDLTGMVELFQEKFGEFSY